MRIGTRGSALALAQTRQLARQLADACHVEVKIVQLRTSGDGSGGVGVDGSGGGSGSGGGDDKSRWVDTIDDALLAGEIDLAVHSAKDVPGALADGLELLGAPARAPVEDVLCLAAGHLEGDRAGPEDVQTGLNSNDEKGAGGDDDVPKNVGAARACARTRVTPFASTYTSTPGPPPLATLATLAPGAKVGTSSIRRAAQLRAARPDLEPVAIAGNVDTRLRKLEDPDKRLHAIMLARAGLQRLGHVPAEIAGAIVTDTTTGAPHIRIAVLDPARFVPAPGQGALALEARADDAHARELVAGILDETTTACLLAERALARALDAGCHTPLGAYARPAGCGCLLLSSWVGLPDGSAWVSDELVGGFYDPAALGERVAERMLAAGAGELLRQAETLASSDA